MTTVAATPPPATPNRPPHGRDPYRFGDGPELQLIPGTIGWSADDLEDPFIRGLFDEGRFEIIDGVLTKMPPAQFTGGECSMNLVFLLREYFKTSNVPARFSGEVDIQLDPCRYLRADAVCIFGTDLDRFEQHARQAGRLDWARAALFIGPSLIIESISLGHESHDRKTKRRWYAELGAQRYWIVDAFARSLECLWLDNDTYREEAVGHRIDSVSIPSLPGLTIPLVELWGD
jgi:Uma2 family endonuclease